MINAPSTKSVNAPPTWATSMPFPNKSVVTMSRVSPARKRLVSSARSAAGMSPIKEALENPASVSRPSAVSTALHSTSGWRGRGGGTRTVRDGSTHETATDGMCFRSATHRLLLQNTMACVMDTVSSKSTRMSSFHSSLVTST
jgi:hypothetical protein